jgi:hypothetical protein
MEQDDPSGAPGDKWRCHVCGQLWVAESFGDLDIKWIRKDEKKEGSIIMGRIGTRMGFGVRTRSESDPPVTLAWDDGRGDSPVDGLLERHLGPAIALFRTKARDYGERSGIFTADLLGSRGQFAEIWRKVPKLKKGMWDEEPLENESVTEILQDLIGHCLLALDYLDKAHKDHVHVATDGGFDLTHPVPGVIGVLGGIPVRVESPPRSECTQRRNCPKPLGDGDRINGPAADFPHCPVHNPHGFL